MTNSKTKWSVMALAIMGLLCIIYLTVNYKRTPHWRLFKTNHSEKTRNRAFTPLKSTNWEDLTRNDPILENWTSCADSESSVIYIREKKPSYKVGDVVTVDITLKDFLGRRKRNGGDLVRLLVKDEVNVAGSTGYIVDKHDGTYKGVVKLLWAGNVTIEARVFSPRELIKLVYDNVRTGRIKKPMLGLFRRDSNVRFTNCTPMEELASHYKEACNLTYRNANLPWFCEKPQNFSCKTWGKNTFTVLKIVNTGPEQNMIKRLIKGLKMRTTITLRVVNETTGKNHYPTKFKRRKTKNSIPCNKLPAKNTWMAKSPVGYLYRGTWHSTQCRGTFNGSLKSFQTCLQDRPLWLLGDSNMREMTSYFINIMKLNLTTEKWTNKKWHKPSLAADKKANVSVFWGIHALPRYYNQAMVKGTHQYIDGIPSQSKDIIIVHFYMHFLPFHPSVVRKHIRKTAQSIKALKNRAPEVKVVVRGSHACFIPSEITNFNDFWGIVYDRILKEEFASLVDEVIFLDMWDLTVATENRLMHPSKTVMNYAVNYIMSLICP